MKKFKLNVYPRIRKEELPFYKRLSDIIGLLSVYPLISVIAHTFDTLLFLFVSETYLVLLATFMSIIIILRRSGRERLLGVILALGIVATITPYILVTLYQQEHAFIGLAGKLLIFVATGLYIHEISRKLEMRDKLDKFGGLIVFGSLALLIREPVFILGGLILLALGLGGATTELKKLYYANLSKS